MRVQLNDVSMGARGVALPATSLSFTSGRAVLAVAETEQRPSVLGLIAAGRMRPATGTVSIDDLGSTRTSRHGDRWQLRDRVALVDAVDVNDPAPNVTVLVVTAEELMFAGVAAGPAAAMRWLRGQGLEASARLPIGDLDPGARVRLLLELAALRTTSCGELVEGIVLVSPDRHGGDPFEWWALAEEFAARGHAVLVVAGAASAAVLAERAPRAETDFPIAENADAAGPDVTADRAEEASR